MYAVFCKEEWDMEWMQKGKGKNECKKEKVRIVVFRLTYDIGLWSK